VATNRCGCSPSVAIRMVESIGVDLGGEETVPLSLIGPPKTLMLSTVHLCN
jgi:hypothetical protein